VRRRARAAWRLLPMVLLAGAVAAGCGAKAKAADAPAVPPLAVPPPPARSLPPIDEGLHVLASNPSDGPITESTATIAKPAPPDKRQRAQDADPNPDAAPPAAPPLATPPPAESVRSVVEDAREKELEAELKKSIDAFKRMSPRIPESSLSARNRVQYLDAKQFMEIAERAFKERRFSYGLVNANKALTIAQQLVQ
jgi:hypothetical protein